MVSKAAVFAGMVDSKGTGSPFAILVSNPKHFVNVLQIIHGVLISKRLYLARVDLKTRFKFLNFRRCPSALGGFLSLIRTDSYSHQQDRVRAVIPSESRPEIKSLEKSRDGTFVVRVVAEAGSRFCTAAGWTKAKQQPGPFARKWCGVFQPHVASRHLGVGTSGW